MKSVIAQGSTIAKAIEEALKKSDSPQEFFVKILEDAQAGFLGFGSKKAKIALFFKDGDRGTEKPADSMLSKGSYLDLFNNPDIKKQIDLQLKELGLEIKPIKSEQVEKKVVQEQPRHSKMQIRPLNATPSRYKQQYKEKKQEEFLSNEQEESLEQLVAKELNSSEFLDQKKEDNKSSYNKRRRYYRYRRGRNRNRSDQDSNESDSFSKNLDNSKKDE